MNHARIYFPLFVILTCLTQVSAFGENWPGWRGPRGDGTSLETDAPTKWSATENVAWKVAIPGRGHSSPVIWGDRMFLTTALTETKERVLLSLERKTGKPLWQKTVLTAPLEKKQPENSYASSTPVTDGEKVYVAFLEGKNVVVAAYDFSGEQKWIVKPGTFESIWGFCHSPVLLGEKLLLACCGQSGSFVAALNKADGKTLWCAQPPAPVQAFGAPLVAEMAGRMQMIVQGAARVISYDPNDGKELWTTQGPSKEFVATPVYNAKAGLLLCISSWPARVLVAIKPDGQGDVTASKIVWQTKEGAPYVPSAVAVDNYFLTSSFDSNKSLFCYEAATGNVLWKHENAGLHHASPVTAAGLVYFINDNGVMNVLKAGPKLELVATNNLGEKVYASPAISQGQMFLRSFNHLYCIGTAK